MSPWAALRAARSGRDRAAYYREVNLKIRAGVSGPVAPWPGGPVPFEAALLKLGEESGHLEEITRLLSDYFAAEDRMVLKVINKAAYPMFVALAAAVIGPLPLIFRGHALAYLVIATAGTLLWAAAGGALLRGTVDRYLAQPKFVLGRLLRALTIAIEAGLPLGRAATLAADASGSPDIIAHVRGVGARAGASQPLAVTFRGCPFVPFTALAAMEVADASGDYGNTLRRLADLTGG